MADDEMTESNVGYTTRDLVIQANTKLDNFIIDLKELRLEVTSLSGEVDALKTTQAVNSAKSGTKTELRTALYAAAVLAAYWFGPVIDKAITH